MLLYELVQGQGYCGRLNNDPPSEMSMVLISGTCEHVTLWGRRHLEDVLKVMGLVMERLSWIIQARQI